MHYHLTEMADPIVRTLRDAVGHAIMHLEPVRRDSERLQKATGCCAHQPSVAIGATLPCCSGAKAASR